MRAHAAALALAVTAIAPSPPPVTGWPPYPYFPTGSCWARNPATHEAPGAGREAPAVFTRTPHVQPQAVVARVLAGLGDRRFVKRVEIGPVPRLVREHTGWLGRAKHSPPRTAVWAWLSVPRMGLRYVGAKHPSPADALKNSLAEWEAQLVWGDLRDAFCSNGGPALVGWSVAGHPSGVSDATYPFGQRFPSPSRAAFTSRARVVGRRYGFRVVSIRWLHGLQPAPVVVVRTDRKRISFVGDVPAIEQLLDPRNTAYRRTATTFEGFFFAARDAKGPFVATFGNVRATRSGGQWAWNPCHFPFPTFGGPIMQRC